MNLTTQLARLSQWAERVWYKDPFIGVWLMPFGFFYSDIVRFRKFLYRMGVLKSHKLAAPVIIVGNITVGGTGKTPLVIWLAQYLRQQGYNPGVISRGFKGQTQPSPQLVSVHSTPEQVGDEAMLIAKHSGCPVAVCPDRVAAGRLLIEQHQCSLIIADDGLQHYALQRDIEIAVIDGQRRFGNSYCLPAGPLREPINRLQSVDLIVVNGERYEDNELAMRMIGTHAINLTTGQTKALSEWAGLSCHALAGIGNPQRFFDLLQTAGLVCDTVSFPDHHLFHASDIQFNDTKPVLMTEKDAVKCVTFADERHWYVPITAEPEQEFVRRLMEIVNNKL